ncbi:gluconate transporter [Lucifera butyrica]|uniref:Gluconate transporter n=1 Tax=Lucifera butyrica TaxID=1351585 RepID=A0A498RCN8_9FIRM|nr:GntP family permease [Lucifera butyrica]VBB07843.1 gluconate transporter [Lucifera butyrica]
MELLAILVSFALLMILVYRGYSLILFAPLCAMLAAAASPFPILPTFSEIYMSKAAEFVKIFFPIMMLGAVFAKIMEEGGMASGIAAAISRTLGKERAVLAVMLGCGVLVYGGISVFVAVFVMYPFGAVLFREANIPKRLLAATLWMGIFTYAMIALPGTPQIQNIIPTSFFGTTTWAAPVTGVLSAIVYFGLGLGWITYRFRKSGNEGYGNHTLNEPKPMDSAKLPHWLPSILPLVAVVLVNLYMSNPFKWSWAYSWNSNLLEPLKPLKLALMSPAVANVQAVWSLDVALIVGIVLGLIIGRKHIFERGVRIASVLSSGVTSSLTAVLNTASGFAFGSLVAILPGFAIIKNALLHLHFGSGPLVSEVITTNLMIAFTGSASSGITISLGMLGADWLKWAHSVGMSPQILHRMIDLASAGLDTVPHNGALVTLLAVCGLTHKEAYYDVFVLMMMKVLVPFLFIFLYMITGVS